MRDRQLIISDIKKLVREKGYIYALCMIIFEDLHVDIRRTLETNYSERLSIKEMSLLLGFLIQERIDFSIPDTLQDLFQLKRKTYELMEDLHDSFKPPITGKWKFPSKNENMGENFRKARKESLGTGDMLTEAIFYSEPGAYDFQYLDFLELKYKYDKEWLSKNKRFDIGKSKIILNHIKDILQQKAKKIHLYGVKEITPRLIEKMKKEKPDEDWEEHVKKTLPMIELSQYVELFFMYAPDKEISSMDSITEEHWKSFYKSLIELFVIKKSDFNKDSGIDPFLDNFSVLFEESLNSQFQSVGDFNLINAKPIIQLDEEKYFVPIIFLLFEAFYESPFYWMCEDTSYKDKLSQNRGKTGEEITYEFLSRVFGNERTYRSVKISTKKGHDDTDIDVLCILGSKALCVQVKSKKLTQFSRKGDDKQLQKDFQGAVQDAYEQGLVSRQRILARDAKFFDEGGNVVHLPKGIDEVYIVGITTENYPSLTHQAHVMLDKRDDDPFPIFFTIFDLELVAHYLRDPYDFLYYVRQRISLIDYFVANGEIEFLGYHLSMKLWRRPGEDLVFLGPKLASAIDRNYYTMKMGLEISDEGDTIKNRWKDENFDQLCNKLKSLDRQSSKVTDIIFYLLDWDREIRKELADSIIQTKQKTLQDGKTYDISILHYDDEYSPRVIVTYISLNSDSSKKLERIVIDYCQQKKYKTRGDVWIGFGSLKSSKKMIDFVVLNDKK